MSLSDRYPRAKQVASDIKFWIGFVILIVGLIGSFFIWGKEGFFDFVRNNIQIIWMTTVSIIVLVLLVWNWRLRQRLFGGYRDDFKNLDGWDFEGQGWRRKPDDVLSIKGSWGLTKVGSHWENYIVTFRTKIINKCLGVIIRARDSDNYYMFQIWTDKVRPHRRIIVPVVNIMVPEGSEDESSQSPTIEYKSDWLLDNNNPEFKSIPIKPALDDWFDVKIVVKGQSINLFLGRSFEHELPSILQIPTGKIGFRNAGNEEALVKNLKVTILI